MIIYNVTVNVEHSVHDDWLQWMREIHIPEVMETGLFSHHRILKVLSDEDNGGMTYSVQYYCHSMESYEQYKAKHAPSLQAKALARYKDKFVGFRTLLEEL